MLHRGVSPSLYLCTHRVAHGGKNHHHFTHVHFWSDSGTAQITAATGVDSTRLLALAVTGSICRLLSTVSNRPLHGPMQRFFRGRGEFLISIGDAGIILSVLHNSLLTWILKSPVPEYLGRISYSLYLTHSVVLFATLDLLYGRLPIIGIFAIFFAASFSVAHVFCIFVEEPSMQFGKRLARATERHQRNLQAN